MATLLAANDPQAEEAIELFCRAIVRETAAAAAELGGLDALVFTGGIGSHSPAIRQRVCQGLTWLGVSLSPQANREAALESRLDTGSGPALWTIKTDEQLVIAEHVLQVLKRLGQPSLG
jgi:acetate kinase